MTLGNTADMTALLPRPPRSRWTSFVADEAAGGKKVRALHEEGNPRHRARVEHDRNTLFVHVSDEDGHGWTCLVIDRATRRCAVGQGPTQEMASLPR